MSRRKKVEVQTPATGQGHLVRCPTCARTYRAQVPRRWVRAWVERHYGYPELQCVDCMRAEDLARQRGGRPEDYRSDERAAL